MTTWATRFAAMLGEALREIDLATIESAIAAFDTCQATLADHWHTLVARVNELTDQVLQLGPDEARPRLSVAVDMRTSVTSQPFWHLFTDDMRDGWLAACERLEAAITRGEEN